MNSHISEAATQYKSSHKVLPHKDSDELLLLVILTRMSDHHQEELVQRFQTGTLKFKVWTPSKALLRSIAKQGPHLDSQANLYALAIGAYQAGWSTLLVADELTKRQLTDNRRVGESAIASLVMLAVLPNPTDFSRKDEVRVVAVRMNRGDTGDKFLDMNKLLDIKKLEWADYSREPRRHEKLSAFGPPLNLEHGMILHDPDRPVFEPDQATIPTRKRWFDAVVEALVSLPPELVVSILEHADNEIAPQCLPLEACTSTEARSKGQIFLLLYETTPTELLRTQLLIQAAVEKFIAESQYDERFRDQWVDVEVYSLRSHGIRTRRELISFWDYYRDPERHYLLPRVHFVLKRIRNDDLETAQFGMACTDFTRPTVILRTSVNFIVASGEMTSLSSMTAKLDYDDHRGPWMKNAESMNHPDQPFWYNPPLWMSASDGRCSPKDIPLFQLTQNLTEDEIETAKEDLISDVEQDEPQDCKKEVCLVPWRRTRDATMHDIWRIFWEFWKIRGMETSVDRIFCVDRQTAKDGTVLVIMPY